MAFDTVLGQRLAFIFKEKGIEVTQKKMFGGLCFLYNGKMTVGIVREKLCARVVGEKMEEYMALEFTEPMAFTGKPMKEFIYVNEEGFKSDLELEKWIDLGVEHAKMKLNEK